ncbi:MAG: DUF1778 domain-containing protein [Rickettsiales bacterium]|jgi:uncharacterized protein (DUF1778 family)|nr:DUF1778 domain-containing protein [Rickettsiales bacterium]
MATALKQTTIRFNDAYTRNLAEKAAELQGQSLSAFVMFAIREHGESVIRERTRIMREFGAIVLSPRDYDDLVASMKNPPKPNGAFRKTMEKHKASATKWE